MFKTILTAFALGSMLAVAEMPSAQANAVTYAIPLTRDGASYTLSVHVNGHPVVMTLDTGADGICLPIETYNALTDRGLVRPMDVGSEITVGTAGGSARMFRLMLREVTVYGVSGGWQLSDVWGTVGCDTPLLGQKFLRSVESYSIDNKRNMLMLNTPASSYTPPPTAYTPPPLPPRVPLPPVSAYAPPAPSYTPPPPAYDPALQSFTDGQRDRRIWEAWFTGLADGTYKQGAEHWATVRSTKEAAIGCHPPIEFFTLEAYTPGSGTTWMAGCSEAKRRLTPTDARRTSDPNYKAGWNSIPDPA
jgi:hypothetical protein